MLTRYGLMLLQLNYRVVFVLFIILLCIKSFETILNIYLNNFLRTI